MYYAVKFDEHTRERLLEIAESLCPIPDDWKIYCDHITMCHSSNEKWGRWKPFLDKHLGETFMFRITGYGKSDNAFALTVDFTTANPVSHITIACAPGAKPVQSNDIDNWTYPEGYDFIQPFIGTIELCKQ